eukprot:1185573-Lingulodinium_polyedra.AAC.1
MKVTAWRCAFSYESLGHACSGLGCLVEGGYSDGEFEAELATENVQRWRRKLRTAKAFQVRE